MERPIRASTPEVYKADNPAPISERRVVRPKELTQNEWESLVMETTSVAITRFISDEGLVLGSFEEKGFNLSWEEKVLKDMYKIEQRLQPSNYKLTEAYARNRSSYLRNLAKEIRKTNKYHVLPKLMTSINESKNVLLTPSGKSIVAQDVLTLYLLLCEPNRFIVGLKDGVHRKRVNLPDEMNVKDFGMFVMDKGRSYFSMMNEIGRQELDAVSDNLFPPFRVNEAIHVPEVQLSAEDLLEDAYYRKRYMVPIEGADVRLRHAGDIDRILIFERDGVLLGRAITARGDIHFVFDLNTAKNVLSSEGESWERLNRLVVSTYHDLLTAEEVSTKRFKNLKGVGKGSVDRPQVIYIPRKVRTEEGIRDQIQGPPRFIEPHRVSGYKRRGNLSLSHRDILRRFEREHGISILAHLPTGFTFVRPHISPSDPEARFDELPKFIKARLQSKLAQDLREPQ